MRTALRACILASALAFTSSAAAEGVALSRFEPAVRGSRFFWADSLDLGRADGADGRPLVAAGIASTWAPRLTTWGDHRQGKRDTLVRSATELWPGGSVAIAPGARFALDVPVTIYQTGESTNFAGRFYPAPAATALGDVRAKLDLRILGPSSRDVEGITLGGGVTAWIPTGSAANFTGDDFTRFGLNLASSARYGLVLASARVGYMYRRDTYLGGSRVGPEVNAVVGVAAVFKRLTVGPELQVSSAIDSEFAKRATPVELLLGAHDDVGPLRVGVAVSFALVPGMGSASGRGVFTVEWLGPDAREARDRDGDGLIDKDDLCPDLPGDVSLRGCPAGPPPELVPPVEIAPLPPVEERTLAPQAP